MMSQESECLNVKTQYREEWLHKVEGWARPLFKQKGFPLPAKIRLGTGWPSTRALSGGKKRTLGECWLPSAAKDKANNIVISMFLDDSMEVAGTLIHELAHAAVQEGGHAGAFVACIRAIGIEGKPTEASTPSAALKAELKKLFKKIGPYPHSSVDGTIGKKKQTTRMVKLECQCCGYIVRTTQKWIDSAGMPLCPQGEEFSLGE